MLRSRADGTLQLDIEWANVNQWQRTIRVADLHGVSSEDLSNGFAGRSFRIEQDAGIFTFRGDFTAGRGSGNFTFEPHPDFAATLRAIGVSDADRIGIHQLKNLAFGFMSADAIRQLMAAGIRPLSLRDIVDLSVYQVTPEFVRALQAQGYTDLTPRRVIDLRMTRRVKD
jgi:hypothetical protein